MTKQVQGDIQLENACYTIGETQLLGPITLSIPVNGITAVLGHNGAGKTLFLRLVHGAIMPTTGNVTQHATPMAQTRSERGFIFQDNTIMRRSVRDNITFPLEMSKLTRQERIVRCDELLDMVQLKDLADHPAAVLSGGESQRMALARALVSNPKLVIMDEPTSSLDPAATAQFERIVTAVNKAGVGFIWATHDRAQAQRCSHSVLFLEDGHIVEQAKSADFFQAPQSEAAARYLDGKI